jgi:hypothetical protein
MNENEDGTSTTIDSSSIVTSSIPSTVSTKNLVKVSIDAGMSAYANARSFFDQKRQSAAKYEKTMAQADNVRSINDRSIDVI